MRARLLAPLIAAALASCSSKSSHAPSGRVVIALTIDWEGAYISLDGLDAIDAVRADLGDPPITHFLSAGYFTKASPDPEVRKWLGQMVHPGDQVALHLHAWKSLATASKLTPKLAPSFLTGTDKLLEFEDGDVGFDTDLDAYTVTELRALLRTSRRLIEAQGGVKVSKTFRAGGYLGTPKVLEAIHDEGYAIDSSATDYRQLDERLHEFLPGRVKAIWPDIDTASQPRKKPVPGGSVLEVPIAAFADYATAAEIAGVVEAAYAKLQHDRGHDVFVVLGFHQETAAEFGKRIREAFAKLRGNPQLMAALSFTTIEAAALMAERAPAR